METRYQTKHCTVGLNHEISSVEIVWNGAPDTNEFKLACNKVIELMAEMGWYKVLTDNRNSVVFGVKDVEWLNTEWLENAVKVGYKVTASVVDQKKLFVDYAVSNVINARKRLDIDSKRFASYDSAVKWLDDYIPS